MALYGEWDTDAIIFGLLTIVVGGALILNLTIDLLRAAARTFRSPQSIHPRKVGRYTTYVVLLGIAASGWIAADNLETSGGSFGRSRCGSVLAPREITPTPGEHVDAEWFITPEEAEARKAECDEKLRKYRIATGGVLAATVLAATGIILVGRRRDQSIDTGRGKGRAEARHGPRRA